MIKRPKRLLALTMGLALLLGTLAGCNSTPSASSTGTDGAQSSGASASEGGETGGNADRETVNIRFSQYANSTDDAEGMANDPIKKAIEEKVNVTLEYDTGIEGYDDRLATEVAVGAAPDLFPTWGSAATLKKYAEEEAVWNIAEIINAEPDRYPILHKIINSDEYKMYNKMYTGDECSCTIK